VASEVARAVGIHTSQLFRWRQQLCERIQAPTTFNPVAITPEPGAIALPSPNPVPERTGMVEIEFATGDRMRITGPVDFRDAVGADRGTSFPSGTPVWLAAGHTDMRKGFDGLALMIQEVRKRIRTAGICSCSVVGAAD
jgi:hypothetical protein